MHCCYQGEGNWCTTVLKEKETVAILLMFQEKGTGALLFSSEGRRAIVLLRKGVVQGAVPSLLVDSDESLQLAIVKFGKRILAFAISRKLSVLSR